MATDDMSPNAESYLKFLRDDGIEVLALYKKITDPADRQKVLKLMQELSAKNGRKLSSDGNAEDD